MDQSELMNCIMVMNSHASIMQFITVKQISLAKESYLLDFLQKFES